MQHQYRLYGLQISHFSGKLRGYLNYKGLDYEEKAPDLFDMVCRFPKKVGAAVVPVIETNSGEWLGDTTDIIEEFERRHPQPSIAATTPKQTIASMLFGAWCDDFWLPVSLHTRWSHPENYPVFRHELGKGLLPYAPNFVRNWLADNMAAAKMRDAAVAMGVVPNQVELLDQWIATMLDTLEQHFAQYDYLFGGRPTIADYSLLGCLYGHLSKDPWPRRELIAPRPHLKSYIERLHSGDRPRAGAPGELLPDDEIPATLLPMFSAIFNEFFPLLEKMVESVYQLIAGENLKKGDVLPRATKKVSCPMGNSRYERIARTFPLWMMQRIAKVLAKLPTDDRAAVRDWFASFGRGELLEMDLGPDVERAGLTVRLIK